MIVSTFCIAMLLFFYTVVLFSEKWPGLKPAYDIFRLLFSIPEGLVIMYALFTILALPLIGILLYGAHLFTHKKYATRKQIILLCAVWACTVIAGLVLTVVQTKEMVSRMLPFSPNPVVFNVGNEIPLEVQIAFKSVLKNEVQRTQGMPIEGYEPFMFLKAFPGLTATDFEGVEASIGHYTIQEGKLMHVTDNSKLIHSAAKAITDRGLNTLLSNVSVRLKVDLTKEGTLTNIMEALVSKQQGSDVLVDTPKVVPKIPKEEATTPPDDMVMCTMDAKMCPDGSYVGRSGPSCAFAPCPLVSVDQKSHVCTATEKEAQACTREYAPVCGQVVVQCIKAPCPPIPQTFSNGCSACGQGNVDSYTAGACAE